jgi:hypothetical protein
MESIVLSTQPAVSRNRWRIHLTLIAGYCLLTGLLGGKGYDAGKKVSGIKRL